ncbi:hypothetical protein Tel_12545 [Candidatus Tenderia electrophaga]|mgnify:CR=1 FL=1|jgi:formamidopyrimidine-DNA glycosylase|uniref:Uncharacterized protein n=1 Tax=Candidatus Tenderia electrophaga TaxID=1748243 RepID=A0A0S2TFE5_9GAMM|nr:hypothetical protein Tel_12545 [Candidatus Tenderia electrophaga]
MPELADVEVFRQYLNATALHQEIAHTHVEGEQILAGTSPQGLGRALKNNQFDATRRHGKYLFIELHHGGWLVMHFGMTGRLSYFDGDRQTPEHTQLLLDFKNGRRLAYVAPRKLGRIELTRNPPTFIAAHELGPDALTPSLADFKRLAEGRRGSVKGWLMNQQVMAGIGNVYADEILFQARIHPRRKVQDLDARDLDTLYKKIHQVFDAAIAAKVAPDDMPDDFLLPHRKKGGNCPGCQGKVKQIAVSGRNGWYCPRCQE